MLFFQTVQMQGSRLAVMQFLAALSKLCLGLLRSTVLNLNTHKEKGLEYGDAFLPADVLPVNN